MYQGDPCGCSYCAGFHGWSHAVVKSIRYAGDGIFCDLMKVLYAVDGIFFDFMVLIALLWHREIPSFIPYLYYWCSLVLVGRGIRFPNSEQTFAADSNKLLFISIVLKLIQIVVDSHGSALEPIPAIVETQRTIELSDLLRSLKTAQYWVYFDPSIAPVYKGKQLELLSINCISGQ